MKPLHLLALAVPLAALAAPAAAQTTFSSDAPITIPAHGAASPSPSTIMVSGMDQSFDHITVTIRGYFHAYPDDVDILLVGPQGHTVMLLSDAGGSCDIVDLTMTFADGAAPAPDTACLNTSGTYAPTNHEGTQPLPEPAPAPPYGSSLLSLVGADPNGAWRLFVRDDANPDGGLITDGWSITFASAPAAFAYQGVLKNGTAPVTGPADLSFSVWTAPAAGEQLGPVVARPATPIQDGLFTAELDFGAIFDGSERWLEITVNGVPLSPRQRLGTTPIAARAALASAALSVPWDSIVGLPPAFADGEDAEGLWSPMSYGIFFGAGYVGIGTSTPDNKLTVAGNADITGNLGLGTTAPTAPLSFGSALGDKIAISGAAGGPHYGIGTQVAQFQIHTANAAQDIVLGYGHSTALTETMRIKGNGQVIVGNTGAPIGSTLLFVAGGAAKPGGGSWSVLSDERAKRDILPIGGSLDRLLALRGVSYEYADPAASGQLPGRHLGMVAQQVEPVFPGWIDTRPDGLKTLTFRGFEALTVEALRDLRREKDDQLARLAAENAELRARLDRLEALLAAPAATTHK